MTKSLITIISDGNPMTTDVFLTESGARLPCKWLKFDISHDTPGQVVMGFDNVAIEIYDVEAELQKSIKFIDKFNHHHNKMQLKGIPRV